MPKLTLSVDEDVVARAKAFAAQSGTSVSQLVERYLDFISRPTHGRFPKGLRSVRGVLGRGDRETFRSHLEEKYR